MLWWFPDVLAHVQVTSSLHVNHAAATLAKENLVSLSRLAALNSVQLTSRSFTKDTDSRSGKWLCYILCPLETFPMVFSSVWHFTPNRHFDLLHGVCTSSWVTPQKDHHTGRPTPSPLTYPHNIPPGWDTALPCSLSCTFRWLESRGDGKLSTPNQKGHGMSCRMDDRLDKKINACYTLGTVHLTLSPPQKARPRKNHLLLQNTDIKWSNSTSDLRAVVWKALTLSFWLNKRRNELAI